MSDAPLNRSEAFVLGVCQQSFLSLWCYNNPRSKPGKELCDILVICDPDVIVISVKEIVFNETKDFEVAHDRWERKAVDASVKQLYGAQGWLATATHVIRKDGSAGLNLPPLDRRRLHRIAVALGDKGQAITKSGDFGDGFVHVMGEDSFREVLSELDTITDFTDYLLAKEKFATSGTMIVCQGSEANMLGWYLSHERSFPTGQNVVIFDETIRPGLQSNASFVRRKEADRISYAWDRLVEGLSDPKAKPIAGPGPELNQLELALRTMARETRFNRRILGTHAVSFIEAVRAGKTRSRILAGPSEVIYVIAYFQPTAAPQDRSAELAARCYIARYLAGKGEIMIGVGLSDHQPDKGSASDLIYMHFPTWTSEEDAAAKKLQEDCGYFAQAPIRHVQEDEYPEAQQ